MDGSENQRREYHVSIGNFFNRTKREKKISRVSYLYAIDHKRRRDRGGRMTVKANLTR